MEYLPPYQWLKPGALLNATFWHKTGLGCLRRDCITADAGEQNSHSNLALLCISKIKAKNNI
jgi:hypothetical protein